MAVEIPKDLITHLQISVRKQANVASYDPNDSSLPNLPSLPHSDHRCLHCKANLLRGADSLLCILCGKHQSTLAAPPPPIRFKSTSGYHWFLRSLNLNGSEMVGESLEGNESNRGPREEFPLSDLLDLEIIWNDAEVEKFESSLRKNHRLNLAGFDVDDDFLAERRGDSVSVPSEGTCVVKKETDSSGSNAFRSGENLSLFESFQGSKSSGSVSGWQADFQSADSKTDYTANCSQSFAAFGVSSKDLSSQKDTVFGHGKNLFEGNEKDNEGSSELKTNDWFQDNMQSNSTSGMRTEDAMISSFANADRVQGDQGQIGGNDASVKKTADDDDNDSFDAWNDFKGSTNAQNSAQSSLDQTASGMQLVNEKGGDSFTGSGPGSESTLFETQHEVSKSFDHFAGSSADLSTHMDSVFGTGNGKAVGNSTSSHTSSWFQDDLWSNSTSGAAHQVEHSDVDIGDKDGGMLGNLNNSSVNLNRNEDDQWPTNSNRAADNGTNDEDDDSFGAWNDFKSSSAPDSSISSWKKPANHLSSTEEKSSDPFSALDANFQTADTKNLPEGSTSSDLFVGSSTELSHHMDTVFISGKDLVDEKVKDSSSASNSNNWFQDDIWSHYTSKVTHRPENVDATTSDMDSGTAQSVQNSSSMNVDWFPDDQCLTSNQRIPDKETVDELDDSFDKWNDFTSSTTMQDASSNSLKQAAIPDKKTIDDNDDLSAAWNAFTSSSSAKDASSSYFKQNGNHEKPSIQASEMNLFSLDSNNNSSGSLSQPYFFSSAFCNQNVSTEAPVSDRMADTGAIGGSNADITRDTDFSSATTGSKTNDLEILMSQMHDLSFMLESNFSIPAKIDGLN